MTQTLSPWRPLSLDRFLLGVCHYPEHEPRNRIREDAALMADAGLEVARLGEFAWNVIEPEEGRFDFSLFDEAIEELGRQGIDTIFCTPTATPPRWLTARHPDMLRRDALGRSMRHGSRQHVDLTHPLFRDYSKRITRAVAEHYRDNKRVIGWQTDNELNTHFSETHSEAANAAFREWLQRRYRDVATLNEAWGSVFWNRTYDNFEQVDTPITNLPAAADPSHVLDYHRFLADSTADFHRDQTEILKATNPQAFVFHNIGRLNDTDLRDLGRDVDFMGVDVYPLFRDDMNKIGLGYTQAMMLDMFRGWTGNFIVPEIQTGGGAAPAFGSGTPEPGELRRFTFSSVARGADGIIYFRWRTPRYGAEAYWMGVIDHDGVPRRRFAELKQTVKELKALAPDVLGTTVDMDVVILGADWDNHQAQASFAMGYPTALEATVPLHQYCYDRNIRCGYANPADDLAGVKVAFVPHLPIWRDAWTAQATRFVEEGGTLVIGARTATRGLNNHVLESTPPGPLSGLCGAQVVEFGRMPEIGASGMLAGRVFSVDYIAGKGLAESARRKHFIALEGGDKIQVEHTFEVLEVAEDTDVIARWASRAIEGLPAATRRRVGKGSVIYLGTYLTPALAEAFFGPLFQELGVKPPLDVPRGVEVTTRSAAGRTLTFIQNTTAEPVSFETPEGRLELGAYDCKVLKR